MEWLKVFEGVRQTLNISHTRMAELLGITTMHWWRIRTEKVPISSDIKQKALRLWPDAILPIFLSENVKNTNN